jgi:hypothetical protein
MDGVQHPNQLLILTMGRNKKFGEETTVLSFRVPKKKKESIKMACIKIINQKTKHDTKTTS